MTLQIANINSSIFSRNPSEVTFRKQGILSDTSGYASLLLIFDSGTPPVSPHNLKLDINGVANALAFTFGAITASPLRLPAYVSGSFGDYIKTVAQALYRHPTIAADYEVKFLFFETPLAAIQIIARKRGSAYNIELNASSTVYTDAASTAETFADDDTIWPNYQLQAAVDITTDADYNQQVIRIGNLVATGMADVDNDSMQITLHDLPALAKENLAFDVPVNAVLPLPVRKSFARLALEITEAYADDPRKSQVQKFSDISTFTGITALLGGFDLRNYPAGNISGTTPGYTLQATDKLVSKEQPEWLHIPMVNPPSGITGYALVVKYSDGSTLSKNISISSLNVGVWSLPTGFDQNALEDLNPGATVISWQVEINEQIIFNYVLDSRYFSRSRYFIYQNTFGFVDTLRCVGVNDFSVKYTRANTTHVLSSASRTASGTIEMILNEREDLWTMRTGWLMNQQEKDALLDMLGSTYVAEVIMPLLMPLESLDPTIYYKQPYRSCILMSDTVEMYDEATGTWALEWKMKYAHEETNYSNLPMLPEVWYGTEIECTVFITADDLPSNPIIEILTNASCNFKVEVNGVETDWSTNQLAITAAGLYHFKFSGSACTDFSIDNLGDCGEITICSIVSMSLENLTVMGFVNVATPYLAKRLENLFTLVNLTIECPVDPGFDTTKLLTAMLNLYNKNYGLLAEVNFSNATPTTQGLLMKAALISNGITVNTL